ncbi:hypothetical protein MtrunA17_Chr2g0313241 [Medicago truncatula]|uniref:Uncharacterized protein n=1 Tax=Medicago truncatula TaxID=3880 RepID=I3SDS7_MEDTR|nr:unknown [Medicago truncatula]RHN74706.1 hypothetical protein MtrunA17_Chr2g0313241 [Medicago truncatula]
MNGGVQKHTTNSAVPALENRWVRPPQGYTKCNVGCALFSNSSLMGVGLCFRDHTSHFVFT